MPLSRYFGKPETNADKFIAHFPLPLEKGEKSLPQWTDLSLWMKLQMSMLLMYEYASLSFCIHVHPKLEEKWGNEGRNPTAEIRDRLRKELDRLPIESKSGVDWFFTTEGWTDENKRYPTGFKKIEKTFLHIHGAIALPDEVSRHDIERAVERACGHGVRGYETIPRAIRFREFYSEGPAFGIYILKFLKRKDERLAERRTAFSRTLTQASRDFWEGISGRWEVYHGMLYGDQAMERNAKR